MKYARIHRLFIAISISVTENFPLGNERKVDTLG